MLVREEPERREQRLAEHRADHDQLDHALAVTPLDDGVDLEGGHGLRGVGIAVEVVEQIGGPEVGERGEHVGEQIDRGRVRVDEPTPGGDRGRRPECARRARPLCRDRGAGSA